MKKVICVILGIMLVLPLWACNDGIKNIVSDPERSAEIPMPEFGNIEAPEPNQGAAASGDISGNLLDCEVSIDGAVYKLPCKYSEFEANGWEIEEDPGKIEPNKYASLDLMKDRSKIRVSVTNFGGNVVSVNDCHVTNLYLDGSNYGLNGMDAFIAKGITFGASIDEVKAAFGDPKDQDDYEYSIYVSYENDSSDVRFTFDVEDNKRLSEISINCNELSEEAQPSTEVSDEIPSIVQKYVAPTSIPDDWKKFTVKYDGKLYKLPAPVSEFTSAGWELEEDTDPLTVIKAKDYKSTTLENGKMYTFTYLYNFSANAEYAKHCFVSEVGYDINRNPVNIELAKGITQKSKKDAVIKAYGKPDQEARDGDYEMISYGTYDANMQFIFDAKGKIMRISLKKTDLNI